MVPEGAKGTAWRRKAVLAQGVGGSLGLADLLALPLLSCVTWSWSLTFLELALRGQFEGPLPAGQLCPDDQICSRLGGCQTLQQPPRGRKLGGACVVECHSTSSRWPQDLVHPQLCVVSQGG